jgi:hypothetical protein
MYSRKKEVVIDAKAVDTTSGAIVVSGAKKIIIEFIESGTVLNRSAVLTITGSMEEGGTHVAIPMVDNVANTNAQTITRVASKTRNAAGRDIMAIDLEHFGFAEIKAAIDVTDGATPTGAFTVNAFIEK